MTHSARSLQSSTAELVGSQTPRIWTPRRPDLPTYGEVLTRFADIAGLPFDPWQQLVADVASEYHEDSNLWARKLVTLLVARQNGKTQVIEMRILAGLFAFNERLILHTAQDRAVPRASFMDIKEIIENTPALSKRVAKIRETNGQEAIELKTGATYQIVAPKPKSSRSWTANLIIFDEAREQSDRELWGAAIPTISAVPKSQIWAVSNAGDPDSVVLNTLRKRGRAAAEDPASDPTMAYLEWSASPQDDGTPRDLDDRVGWAEANPAYGIRITDDAITNELLTVGAEDPNRFRTERLCQWVDTSTTPAIPWHKWAACAADLDEYEPGLPRPQMGIHINGQRTYAALAIAVERDGHVIGELADEWSDPEGINLLDVTADVLAWAKHYKVRDIAFDRAAASVIAQRLEQKHYTIHRLDRTEYVVASQNLFDAVITGHLQHRNNPTLNAQIRAAGRKTGQDDSWHISQAHSDSPITAVIALAFAVNLTYRPRIKPEIL